MWLEPADAELAAALRARLDLFHVGQRLQYVREFVWRGGHLQLQASNADVAYVLTAEWPAAVLEQQTEDLAERPMPVLWQRPVVDGRWVRGTHGYVLHIGISATVPNAIYVRARAQGFLSHVPFLRRPPAQVDDALTTELATYVSTFTSHCEPVPRAAAREAERLRQLGLAA